MLLKNLGLLGAVGPPFNSFANPVLRHSAAFVISRNETKTSQISSTYCRGHKSLSKNNKPYNPKILNVTSIHPAGRIEGVRLRSTLASRLVESSPSDMQPYMKLARLDKPVGT